jgi:aspartate/methionine/tyrosine aminotransferase
VVINPGNPTGSVLPAENVGKIIRFAKRRGLALLADEVYQENVYAQGKSFFSFARAMDEMGESTVPLFSINSVSKGFLGECGHRGGYLELRNVPDDVMAEFAKLQSISLCANVDGRDGILSALKSKAEILGRGIGQIPGMSLDVPEGAMYAFVRFELPDEPGVDAASFTPEEKTAYEAGRDTAYCLALLEETGICVVPGSGFGQEPGTLHFRTTFLPPQDEIEQLVGALKAFHIRYVRELTTVRAW